MYLAGITTIKCVEQIYIFRFLSKLADYSILILICRGSWGDDLRPLAHQRVGAVWSSSPLLPVLRARPTCFGWEIRVLLPPLMRLVGRSRRRRGGLVILVATILVAAAAGIRIAPAPSSPISPTATTTTTTAPIHGRYLVGGGRVGRD